MSGGSKEVMVSGSGEAESSEATIEIKIKTLDSQTYTLRVDKSVPVPALKEQIATVTGVLSDQQRLICRGKVLKDDQLLSAYHVEDGHTLHLVVRQPIQSSSESYSGHPVDPASRTGHDQGNQVNPNLVVGSFNISEQGDEVFPDFGQIVSAVLGSFGIPSTESGSEAFEQHDSITEGLSRQSAFTVLRNPDRRQPEDASSRDQMTAHDTALRQRSDVLLEPLLPPVIPDSLTTMTQYLSHMRQEFSGNARAHSTSSQDIATSDSNQQDSSSPAYTGPGGLPTPVSLAEVIVSTRQLLMEQVGENMMQLARQLQDHASVTDAVARARVQSNTMRSGVLLQNLGSFLLELGRATTTLRLGQSTADAVVNAGPAVFVSPSGPNPLMVQAFPFQPGTNFGAVPVGPAQAGPGFSVRSGFRPRLIDIRIRSGSSTVNQSESSGVVPTGQNVSEASGRGNSTRSLLSARDFRVVPIRTLVATIPVTRAPADASRGSTGMSYPVSAGAQPVDFGNANRTSRGQGSDGSQPHGVEPAQQIVPDSTSQLQHVEVTEVDGITNMQGAVQQDDHGRLDQLLSTMFPDDLSHSDDFTFQGVGADVASGSVEANHDAGSSQEATTSLSDEGKFLSGLLREILPVLSQNISGTDDSSGLGADFGDQTTSTDIHENSDRGMSARSPGDPPSPSSSKRQKRE